MKELDPFVFVAVFQEMLGGVFFWLLVAVVPLVALAFVGLLIRDRGIHARRFVLAELFGFAGGFVGVWLMLWITNSELGDIGGPIDWVLVGVIWLAAAIGTVIAAYIGLTVLGDFQHHEAARSAPSR